MTASFKSASGSTGPIELEELYLRTGNETFTKQNVYLHASGEIVNIIESPEDLNDPSMQWERLPDDELESDYFLLKSIAYPDKFLHAFPDMDFNHHFYPEKDIGDFSLG